MTCSLQLLMLFTSPKTVFLKLILASVFTFTSCPYIFNLSEVFNSHMDRQDREEDVMTLLASAADVGEEIHWYELTGHHVILNFHTRVFVRPQKTDIRMCEYQQWFISAPCSSTQGKERERDRERDKGIIFIISSTQNLITPVQQRGSYSHRLDPACRGISNAWAGKLYWEH